MDFLGIGVFIIALAFAGLVIYLAKVLKKTEEVLTHTAKTVENLEGQIGEITSETKLTLYNTNETIADVNHKLTQLDPLFYIVNDVGESVHTVSSSIVKLTKRQNGELERDAARIDEKDVRGWMRTAAFVYYLTKKRREKKAAVRREQEAGTFNEMVEVEQTPAEAELQREHMNV
ncbi:hypothetical protein CR205_12840 [Alteribacter lacisalsi]|jgi:uncharacterized protein YoxC|uniref:DUF948 domain-containing protein n=1 Tax=Alteribacter lacisalsi TaxID=2045244 RepID=A0A2W0H6I3_9BACI|nr:DUF948 domain-containing protein [Alteribacter lacisalsi]PYZ96591.1 hypothetical protein CR205_12840 [Alteribacter lacisalsi]